MHASEVMTSDVATVSPDTPLTTIAELLLSRHISGVPVVDSGGTLVGVVSEADLMWRAGGEGTEHRSWWAGLLAGRPLQAADFIRTHGTRAADIMSRDLITVAEDTPIEDVVDLFERRRVKRVPVVRGGRVVGIVSRSDLIKTLALQRPPGDSLVDDRLLQDRLQALLAAQPWLDIARVNAVVENGTARLSGLVGSDTERRALHVAARSIAGIRSVEDNLTVGVTPMGGV
ncbi:CBS domain-containing protein [Magnetospirillum sp. UT-4]|uniref:CBS domain-containing protein n=1 Tax=Magnetospirillum sp. UT-4 TaxID=2681467 RepID=UPI00137F9816|nr:CBS domain-containing protein [Magnetospirillum sp. UT-4]CAA7614365.1 CBS-domain-containing membrane protein [Magnetospirillum sp. UT-4]